jgi:hypothetical protein
MENPKLEYDQAKWLCSFSFAWFVILPIFLNFQNIPQLFVESDDHWLLDCLQFVGHCECSRLCFNVFYYKKLSHSIYFHFLAIYLLSYDHFIDHLFASIFTLALAIQLNPYYAILFAPIFLQFRHRLLAALTLSISIISLLLALNFAIEPNSSDLMRSTLAFL